MENSTVDSYQTKFSEHIRTSTIMSIETTIRPLESTIIYVLNNITNDSTMPNITILESTPICTEPGKNIFFLFVNIKCYVNYNALYEFRIQTLKVLFSSLVK